MARLTPQQWRRIDALLETALDLPEADREGFLDEACGADVELRAEVAALLAADAASGSVLDTPIVAGGLLHLRDASLELSADPRGPRARIGVYRILRELGHGGMGGVYLAERADGEFEQQVALKLVRAGLEASGLVRRFRHERQILARLEHPNIARLLDGGVTEDGVPFFVMEHVEGEHITLHCRQQRLSVTERLRLFTAVCDAVAYAHRNLIVHRDLKPSNILVTADGQVKLLDFGIAKLLGAEGSEETEPTRTSLLLTPEYAAPEQMQGGAITTATDVYALGAVLYELLSGQRAHQFAQRSPAELARVVTEVQPVPPSMAAAATLAGGTRLQRQLRGDLDAIVLKALRKEPQYRYASVDALRADVERYRAGLPVDARRGTIAYRARKYARRHRGALTAAALVVLSLMGGLFATTQQARVAQRESARAREVTNFLVGLFRASEPSEARGRELTALELLDSGVARLERELGDEPELQAEMLTVLGSIYRELATLPRADTLLRRAVQLRERVHGPDSEHVVESLNQLGGLLIVTGDYAAADSVLRRALSIRERVLGPRDTLVAVSLNNLAVARNNLGDDVEAEQLYRRALTIDLRAYDADHLQVATDLSNLGGLLRRKADYVAADSALGAAVAIRRRLLRPNDPKLADALSQLALLRNAQGRSEEAEGLYREVLAVRRTAYGATHPDVALALASLASTLSDLGRLEEAKPLQQQAFAIQEQVLGAEHDQTIATLNNIAALQYRIGDVEAAAIGMREALARWERALGKDHPRVLTAANNLGVVLTEKRAYREAEPLLRRALEGRRAAHGAEHPDVATSLRNMGVLLHHTGRASQAEQSFRRALEIGRAVWSEPHTRLAAILLSYGELLLDQGRPQQAEPLLREAVSIRRERMAPDAKPVVEAERAHARALNATGRRAEAAALLRGREHE